MKALKIFFINFLFLIFNLCSLSGQNCDREAILEDYHKSYKETFLYNSQIDWTGSVADCNPGTVQQEVFDKTLIQVNYFRRLVGVEDNIVWDSDNSKKCQEMALMIKANGLDHDPPSSWKCYTSGGAEAAGKSNLAWFNAIESIEKYMADANNKRVGHRRWIIYPGAYKMGIGSTNNSSTLWVIDDFKIPSDYPEYTAYPPPGYFPEPLEYPRWSFAKRDANFTNATVQMFDENQVEIPIKTEDLTYGQGDNTIVFIPQKRIILDEINGLDTYITVKIRNIKVGAQTHNYEYDVLVIPETIEEPVFNTIAAGCNGVNRGSCVVDYPHGYSEIKWSTGETNTNQVEDLLIGNYYVTITDKLGCDKVYNFKIEQEESDVSAQIQPSGNIQICENESIVLVAEGQGEISWSNGSNNREIEVSQEGYYYLWISNDEGCSAVDSVYVEINQLPDVTIESENGTSFCEGDGTWLTAVGIGVFKWSNGTNESRIYVTEAQSYIVTLTDNNNCSNEAEIQINVRPNPQANIIGVDETIELCAGEELELVADAADAYLWSTGATSKSIIVNSTGIYSLSVFDSFGCEDIASTQVNVYSIPEVEINEGVDELSFCEGEVVLLSVENTETVLWSTGSDQNEIQISKGGSYSVTVTNARSCQNSDTINIIENSRPVVTITSSDDEYLCPGESIELTASGGNNYTWSNGLSTDSIEVSEAGIYEVIVTDSNNCTNESILEIFQVEAPIIDSILGTYSTSLDAVESYQVSFVDSFSYIIWEIAGGEIISNIGTEVQILWNEEGVGEICVIMYNKYNCRSEAFCISVHINLSDVEELAASRVLLFPNPCSNFINIDYSKKGNEIAIFNALGEKIKELPFSNLVNTSDLAAGIYFLSILKNGNQEFVVKFVKI